MTSRANLYRYIKHLVGRYSSFLKISNLGIAKKISLVSILFVVVTAGVVVVIFYNTTNTELMKHALRNLSHEAAKKSIDFTDKIDVLREEVRFLAGIPPIQGIIRARKNSGKDDAGKSTDQQWRRRLEHIFLSRLQTSSSYLQIRYIDAMGEELVRVERKQERVYVVTVPDLQNKSDRPYVKEIIKLKKGEVYLSDINLNREHGHIAEPHVVVLRVAMPVFDNKGIAFGFVIINVDFGKQLERIKQKYVKGSRILYIADSKGSYLVHPDPKKRFGSDVGSSYRMQKEFPRVSTLLLPQNRESNLTALPQGTNSMATAFTKITYGSANPGRFIIVGIAQPYTKIVLAWGAMLESSIAWSLVLILFSGLFASRFSALLVKPLEQITHSVDSFMHGGSTGSLPVSRKDEIGVLAKSFRSLMNRVAMSEDELSEWNMLLESQVEERTGRLKEAEMYQRTILETVADAIITIDHNSLIHTFNRAAEKMFGYKAMELVGQNISILLPEHEQKQHEHYTANSSLYQSRIINEARDLEGRHKDGALIPLELTVSRMKMSDGQYGFVGVLRDITERKRIEKLKNEFVSTVSHELRTPLTSIRGALRLLVGGKLGELPEKANSMLEIANNNSERLMLLINDILDIQKIESHQMVFNLQEMDVMPLLEQAVTDNVGYGEEYGISFRIVQRLDDVKISADPDRLMQVFTNLLSNAAKFSPKEGTVEIGAARHNSMVRISITDSGPGIPKEFQFRLFDKFTQADSEEVRHKGGTGLGLSISKALVEKMGGCISFVTEDGIGTTFYIDLPEVSG